METEAVNKCVVKVDRDTKNDGPISVIMYKVVVVQRWRRLCWRLDDGGVRCQYE